MTIQSPLSDTATRVKVAAVARLLHDLMKHLQELIDDGNTSPTPSKDEVSNNGHQLLSLQKVMELVPVSRATLHRMEKSGRFPAPKRLGPHRRAWRAKDVYDWIEKDETFPLPRKRGGTKKKVSAKKTTKSKRK